MSAGRTKKDKYSVHQLSYHPNHNIILFFSTNWNYFDVFTFIPKTLSLFRAYLFLALLHF